MRCVWLLLCVALFAEAVQGSPVRVVCSAENATSWTTNFNFLNFNDLRCVSDDTAALNYKFSDIERQQFNFIETGNGNDINIGCPEPFSKVGPNEGKFVQMKEFLGLWCSAQSVDQANTTFSKVETEPNKFTLKCPNGKYVLVNPEKRFDSKLLMTFDVEILRCNGTTVDEATVFEETEPIVRP